MKPQEFEEARRLWRMFYAEQCLTHARAAGEHIHSKKLHEDDPTFYPEKGFDHSMVRFGPKKRVHP
jgi:hypothetical protein